jgi:hypothetical protein
MAELPIQSGYVQWVVEQGRFDLWYVRPEGMVADGIGFSFTDKGEADLCAKYLTDPPYDSETVYRAFKKLVRTW